MVGLKNALELHPVSVNGILRIFALRVRISMAGYNRGHINPLARRFSFMKQCNASDCADVDEKHWIYGLW